MQLDKYKLNASIEFETLYHDLDNVIAEIERQMKDIELSPKYSFMPRLKVTMQSFETDKVEGNDWEYDTYVNINPKNILSAASDNRNNPFIE
tara:strand:- start:241 stop:516 length:276 start_codon:yes stop_codon:yes gene_type:complete